ncbi:unnamed protein product [Pylaiella littoralis]
MRFFMALLLILPAVGVNGEGNACLSSCIFDPSDSTELDLTNCLIDDDFIDSDVTDSLKECFNTRGRSSITSVNLWGNSITELPADIFAGMTSLTYLNIELNGFTTLPSGIFDELSSLTVLWISNNKFVSLPAGLFDKGLSNNDMGSLEPGMFDSMPKLENLFLSDTGLTSIPAGIFDNTPLLTNLGLSQNDLTTLPAGLFEKLTVLDILSLNHAPDLQCVPDFMSRDEAFIQLDDDGILESGECGCTPAEAVTCPDGSSCAPGATGYTCETSSGGGDYSLVGCYPDFETSRIMTDKQSQEPMSAEICFDMCNDGINTHFGTQYYTEWCGVDPDLTKNGDNLLIGECDATCAGTTDDEKCGGSDKISAYVIGDATAYQGCYRDALPRAMDGEGPVKPGDMTNEVCIAYCADQGYGYAGTQYSSECFCGDSFDAHGSIEETECSYPCQADSTESCGGKWALSVYATGGST